ncbi:MULTISPECIES: SDR family oxidoreductase [Streptomyces]|uniref:SDR family oxidoreductase n=1 Tax=Streptomyces TaxID=1883 RepID=UPI000F73E693|nr:MULTISPECIES: SDR family oxidoreductase [Streptomyces]RSS06800.1 SDR family oxidoreductase [Streptomyces sp. WAC00469]WTD46063.1 SDR family oxidoreductase [Streptomyces thermoviolaceus]GGV80704.1 NAD(P)-dependent oxidoreductase [Streptomyces thermoviolaceus subsp. apingens]GHA74220.1 NAD(P)-dependent oxidoreductase [Streptomyces thermoviolaceus subsp. thermoviolaceus]
MPIAVTGATGQLGRLTVEALLRRGIPAADIIATGRDLARIKDLADRGVTVRRADFADPDSLAEAFAGADRLLLVSASVPVGERVAHHRRAIDAAVSAGVSLVAYTSMSHAESATTVLASTHRATEEYLRERAVPSVLLRNSWYLENYTDQLPLILRNGAVVGSAGQGRISAAARADYAEAAAVVLAGEGHVGQVYELGGDEAFTLAELAAAISAATGKRITYTDLPADRLTQVLTDAGLPTELAHVLADADLGMSRGELFTDSGDLRRLIGRPATALTEAIADALR